jgi:tRNA nucleotidyltransferase (CCA-adding enzyme)
MTPDGPVPVPETVLRILATLEDAGHETWCVGGAIRDALVGDPQQDVDLATSAPPNVVQRLFRRTIPVGIEHGTVGVLDEHGGLHEVTTFRADVRTDGRHAEVVFGVSLEEDLARRDFTINAIAWHPIRHEWRDPFDGRGDLARGVVRAVGDADQRFREDRLRILRALRFAARFGWEIAPETWAAVMAQGPDTGHLSAERVREEWWKGMTTTRDARALMALWEASGVAEVWLPAGPGDRPASAGISPESRDPLLLLSYWRGPVEPHLRRLKCSGAEISRGRGIDRSPRRPLDATPVAVRHWLAVVGTAADDLVTLARWHGLDPDGWTTEVAGVRARGEATTRGDLAITGDDLIAEGVAERGRGLGLLLERLLDVVLTDPSCNTREQLMALARKEAP